MNAREFMAGSTVAVLIIPLSYVFYGGEAQASGEPQKTRIVTVAQSPPADFVGADSTVLQEAANALQSGDTMEIGPGTYVMDNCLSVPSYVIIRGKPGQTILKKSDGVESQLVEDGDYGERQLRVAEPEKFKCAMGISISDNLHKSDWDVSVATIRSIDGCVLQIDPMLTQDYNTQDHHASIHNSIPILCTTETDGVLIESIIVDGNKTRNTYIDGCRGGAIYIYRSKDVVIRDCVARNYNGDGISFQITDNVQIVGCESYGNAGHGIHPGAGSTGSTVKGCLIRENGDTGLFLCWRVRHGQIEDNLIQNNGKHGISIGHKDTDNLFLNNTISRNGISGIYFRKETFNNSGHRNSFRGNKVLDNGSAKEGYGFFIEPMANDVVISENQIADTRSGEERTQRFGVYEVAGVGNVTVEGNEFTGHVENDVFEEESQTR